MNTRKLRNGRQEREERERVAKLKYKYEHRISIAKFGKEYLDARDYANALAKFIEYLKIMAEVKEVQDYYALNPSHFNSKTELTEMLMMSHVFFEMSRIYDASPKFYEEMNKCLNQFVAFSSNQPYQVVNSEMVRKYLKKSLVKNTQVYKNAHAQIFVQSKKCYIVTFCYGPNHPTTERYRALKDYLLESKPGFELVRIYYKYSSTLVSKWENSSFMKFASRFIIRPTLWLFSNTLLKFIIHK